MYGFYGTEFGGHAKVIGLYTSKVEKLQAKNRYKQTYLFPYYIHKCIHNYPAQYLYALCGNKNSNVK